MLALTKREEYGWLDFASMDELLLNELVRMDAMWKTHSRNHFGYSIQQELYREIINQSQYEKSLWEKFGGYVGWFRDGRWLLYGEMQFSLDAPMGHLPDGFLAVQEKDGAVVRRWVLALASLDIPWES